MVKAQILSLRVGKPRDLGVAGATDPMQRPWRSGIYKDPVSGVIWLGKTNLEGDGQADLKRHGGPDKAVCVYPSEHYPAWREELGLPDFPFGAFGENFTLEGLVESDVSIGDIFRVGTGVIQVTQPRQPCWKLSRRWQIRDLALQVQNTGRTGWYFRVLEEGKVDPDSELELLEREWPEWTVERANEVMHRARDDRESARRLAECPPLSASWKKTLSLRAETGENPDPRRRLIGPNEDGRDDA